MTVLDVDNAPHAFIQYVKMAGRPSDNEGKCTECGLYEDEGPHETVVIFRVYRGKRGSVFALMPECPADMDGRFCTAYEHVGQHGAADYHGCIARSRPADVWQYSPLLTELEGLGYRVAIRRRATYAMHQRRRAEARKS